MNRLQSLRIVQEFSERLHKHMCLMVPRVKAYDGRASIKATYSTSHQVEFATIAF